LGVWEELDALVADVGGGVGGGGRGGGGSGRLRAGRTDAARSVGGTAFSRVYGARSVTACGGGPLPDGGGVGVCEGGRVAGLVGEAYSDGDLRAGVTASHGGRRLCLGRLSAAHPAGEWRPGRRGGQ